MKEEIKQAKKDIMFLSNEKTLNLIQGLRDAKDAKNVSQSQIILKSHFSVVSTILNKLKRLGIVTSKKDKKMVFYALNEARLNEIVTSCKQISHD
jgi:DNA-binding transcriptional ArsR family regulator